MKINKTGKSLCIAGLFLFLLTIFSDFLRGRRFFIGYAQLLFIGFCVLLIVIGFFFGSSQTWVFVRKICLGVIQKARRINWALFFSVLLFVVMIGAVIYPIKFLWGYYSYPYPYEIRDAAGISVAYDFSRGINPYTLQNFPQNMYIYGFMYPLILSPFINQSVHPILVTKFVDIIFLISYLFITFLFLRKRGASISTTLVGLLILLGSIANVYTRNGARPDVTGLFFSFSGFYLVFREKLTNADVVLSALLCIIAFYFKVYMIFIAPIILLYLFLFVSRGKSALFVLAGFIFAILSYLIIRHVFPTHYDITVMMQLFNEVTYIFTWMIRQTSYFIKYYWILIVILLFNLSVNLFSLFFSSREKKKIPSLFYNKPIFRPIHFDIFDIGILVSVFVLTFSMGGHKGNFYVYYAHLLLPFLVFKVILIIENGIKVNSLRSIMNLFILFFCVFPFSRTYQIDFQARSAKMEQVWQLANDCTNIYEENPILAVYKLEHSMSPIYHNGQNDKASLVDTKKTTVFGRLSMYSSEDYISQLEKWNARINQSLENKDFDCVFSSHIKKLEGYHKDGIVIKGIRNQDIVKFVPD